MDNEKFPQDLLRDTFKKYNFEWEESDKLWANLTIKNKNDMYLYNYNSCVLVPRDHPVLMRCRGLVINKDKQILGYPFDRFFNEYEKERTDINWKMAEAQEKLDGSLVCIFWNYTGWEITTRGSFYPVDGNENNVDFAELFRKHFKDFKTLVPTLCYTFELITKQNRIVTRYNEEMIYLIGARDSINMFKEVSQETLDVISYINKIKRPKQYTVMNVEHCKALFRDLRDDEEGLVVVDDKFNRIKLKQKSYLEMGKIVMLNDQAIFEYVYKDKINEIDVEFLKQLPEVKEKIKYIKGYWSNLYHYIYGTYIHIKLDTKTRKEFAIKACEYKFKAILFAMLDNKDYKQMRLKWDEVKKWK